jgi:hypothetical protein
MAPAQKRIKVIHQIKRCLIPIVCYYLYSTCVQTVTNSPSKQTSNHPVAGGRLQGLYFSTLFNLPDYINGVWVAGSEIARWYSYQSFVFYDVGFFQSETLAVTVILYVLDVIP